MREAGRVSICKVKKNDVVVVIKGAEKGQKGKVLQVLKPRGRVLVEGVNLVKKCLRKSQDNPQGGIVEKEAAMSISQVMLFCPECKKGVKTSRVEEAGKKVRKCKKCGHVFDS